MNTTELVVQVRRQVDREDRYGNPSTPPIFMVQNTDHFRSVIRYAEADFQTNPNYDYGGGMRPLIDHNLRTSSSQKFAFLKNAIRRISEVGGTPVFDEYVEEEDYDVTPIVGHGDENFDEDEDENTW